MDERLGLEAIIAAHLSDSRQGLNTQFRLPDLLRQSIYSRLAGYEDLNDAARLSTDPTFRLIGSPKRWDRSAALTSTLHWFETELLTREENLVGLMAVNRDVIGQAETWDRSDRIVLDMDSSESLLHGQQEGGAYNGHFETVCYHPLFLFNDHGDCLAAKLRSGNVHSADDWDELLLPEIERQQAEGQRVAFRADAAFAKPEIYEALETRGVSYAIRIPANKTLELAIEDVLFRSPGRPSRKPLVRYKSFRYQADSWTTPRRVVAKVEHHVGELFPRVGFIVTNLPLPNPHSVRAGKSSRGQTSRARRMRRNNFPLRVARGRRLGLITVSQNGNPGLNRSDLCTSGPAKYGSGHLAKNTGRGPAFNGRGSEKGGQTETFHGFGFRMLVG